MAGIRLTITNGEFITFRKKRYNLQYLCNYYPARIRPDAASRSLIQFKNNDPKHVEAWSRYAAEAITLDRDCLILRPLSSREMSITEGTIPSNPLDKLCANLARRHGCRYEPWLLAKKSMTNALHNLSRDDRWRVLWNQYRLSGSIDTKRIRQILLVDDIVTTGTTFRALIRLLNYHYPGLPIKVFALARTARNRNSPKKGNMPGYKKWSSRALPIRNYPSMEGIPVFELKEGITLTDDEEDDTFIVR